MTEPINPETPPSENELPQGAQATMDAFHQLFDSVGELFAPFAQRHAGIARDFEQVMVKLREAGFWVQDAVNMMMRPDLFRVEPEAEGKTPDDGQAPQE